MPPSFLTPHGSVSSLSSTEPQRFELYDTTLRDGEQQAGVTFSVDEKVTLFRLLESAQIPYIETGMLPVHHDESQVVSQLRADGTDSQVFVFSRAAESDVRSAAEVGAQGITIEIVVNPEVAAAVFGWSPNDLIEKASDAVRLARDLGLRVNMFGLDATRTPVAWLVEFFDAVVATGAVEWITIADTIGVAEPGHLRTLCHELTSSISVPVQVHCHDDYGLATANSLASVEGGATVVQGSMNGLGERAGNASIAEVAVAGRFLKGWDVGVDVTRLRSIADEVARSSGIPIPWNQPVIGPRLFEMESGIGAAFYERLRDTDLRMMYPYLPSAVGAQPAIVLGKGAGLANIRMRLADLGHTGVDAEVLPMLLAKVKDAGVQRGTTIDEDVWSSICTEVVDEQAQRTP